MELFKNSILQSVRDIKEIKLELDQQKDKSRDQYLALNYLIGFEIFQNFFNNRKEDYKNFCEILNEIPFQTEGQKISLLDKFNDAIRFYYNNCRRPAVFSLSTHGSKLLATVSIIESLMIDDYKPFEIWLRFKLKDKKSLILNSKELLSLSEEYYESNGSTRAIRKFLRVYASEDLESFKESFQFYDSENNLIDFDLDKIISLLIRWRNDFVHKALPLPILSQKEFEAMQNEHPGSVIYRLIDFRKISNKEEGTVYHFDHASVNIDRYLFLFEKAFCRYFQEKFENNLSIAYTNRM